MCRLRIGEVGMTFQHRSHRSGEAGAVVIIHSCLSRPSPLFPNTRTHFEKVIIFCCGHVDQVSGGIDSEIESN